MQRIKLTDAAEHLNELVRAAVEGDTILIETEDEQVVQIVPVEVQKPKKHRQFGNAKGQIWMSDDFDDPLPDFEEYM